MNYEAMRGCEGSQPRLWLTIKIVAPSTFQRMKPMDKRVISQNVIQGCNQICRLI